MGLVVVVWSCVGALWVVVIVVAVVGVTLPAAVVGVAGRLREGGVPPVRPTVPSPALRRQVGPAEVPWVSLVEWVVALRLGERCVARVS